MTSHFDDRETRVPDVRERDTFESLRALLERSLNRLPALDTWLGTPDPAALTDRSALATIPVLRKPDLMDMQEANPPFGGLADPDALRGNRVFMSPGPVWEPQGLGADPWAAARALFAAGFRAGDIIHNSLAYHMTPGGFILDEGARALGCLVFPAGAGNTEAQVDAAARLKPSGYTGTPDFLKIILEKADELGRDLASIKRALVSGGALFPSLRQYYADRGVSVLQCYATADLGIIAYESADASGAPYPGMIVNEDMIVEIVRPGTGDPVPDGEVGELVVTTLNPGYPLVRFGTGDLSAIMPGLSPCGRTGPRIQGWMGRADQRTKVKGMFVDPKQVSEVIKAHPEVARARLVVGRSGDADVMTLMVEPAPGAQPDKGAIEATLAAILKLRGAVEIAPHGSLPNDGKVIADERDYSA
ncbi:MAG: AMP-binding protein [Hoeflea sp.]|uniref:phenylacetate--CoA ligase family protein n=1 Tax=Hoeflea sp. TaxID=1940281 RepID=UPI001E015239|nr:AMP-binding protein [Hoeflea sp.]MBU4528238.1 AMP-binding protein [Alphaproteobacteria bacterium]MBU4543834.1 AMP-binding protein [Alphaproteobacteria bacterium]MBU4548475.1 AMP-binding protein [Alphaproteobacteria bacterium]MBV1722554.1 AMP-binding protein [Hoeflea sp.]MBV1762223.1 AMP-binding protein [Hoeflea sp.]